MNPWQQQQAGAQRPAYGAAGYYGAPYGGAPRPAQYGAPAYGMPGMMPGMQMAYGMPGMQTMQPAMYPQYGMPRGQPPPQMRMQAAAILRPVTAEAPNGAAQHATGEAFAEPMNVFVGKLPLTVHDSFIEALLQKCGPVLKWKRTVDSETDRPKAFGFCTFARAEGAMQAVKLLNDFELEEQQILVKVGKKEQAVIDLLVQTRRKQQASGKTSYSAAPTGPSSSSGSMERSAADEVLLEQLKAFVASVDAKSAVKPSQMAALLSESAGAAAPSTPAAADDGASHDKMIKEEMDKFRSLQARRDRELEDERRRELQAKIQQTMADADWAKRPAAPADADMDIVEAKPADKKRRVDAPAPAPAPAPHFAPTGLSMTSSKLGFGLNARAPVAFARVAPASAAALGFETDDAIVARPLQLLDYSDDEATSPRPRSSSGRDAKSADRHLAERVPTDPTALFALAVDWDVVEKRGLVRSRLRPWICKKIAEYLGEEEPTLIDFVTTQLERRAAPQAIQAELALVLEDDAATLVAKLWRVLHFHILKANE